MAHDHDNGGKATRLEDLAERAGVSISTVSRALNDSPAVNLRTKQAIWKLARELDYPFRRSMPAGPIGAEGTVTVVIPMMQSRTSWALDPFVAELISGVADAARDRGCDMLVSHIAPVRFDDLSLVLTTSRAEGVVFIGQSWLHGAFNQLAEAEVENRFVVWGAQLPEQGYCSVGADNVAGAKRATQHLIRLGRKRILFLGETEAPEAMQRYRGYVDALTEAGLPVDPDLCAPSQFEFESADTSMDALIRSGRKFDAVLAAADLIALGAMNALQRAGVRIPDDVSVVGYDNIPFSRYARPALSTINQDTKLAGRVLVSKLLDGGGSSGASERLPTELLVRESCGG